MRQAINLDKVLEEYNKTYSTEYESFRQMLLGVREGCRSISEMASQINMKESTLRVYMKRFKVKQPLMHNGWKFKNEFKLLDKYNKKNETNFPSIVAIIKMLRKQEFSIQSIADELGVSYTWVKDRMLDANISTAQVAGQRGKHFKSHYNQPFQDKKKYFKPDFEYIKTDRSPCLHPECKHKHKGCDECLNCEYRLQYAESLFDSSSNGRYDFVHELEMA